MSKAADVDRCEVIGREWRIRTSDLWIPKPSKVSAKMQVFAFSKVAATNDFRAFYILFHSLQSAMRLVLQNSVTNWPHKQPRKSWHS